MKKLRITIGNKSYDVTVEDLTDPHAYRPGAVPPTAVPPGAMPAQPQPATTQMPLQTGAVTSPMAGVIKTIFVKSGQAVRQGQPLVILEAMKMENQIVAPVPGHVNSIHVAVGDSVVEGHVLLVLE